MLYLALRLVMDTSFATRKVMMQSVYCADYTWNIKKNEKKKRKKKRKEKKKETNYYLIIVQL